MKKLLSFTLALLLLGTGVSWTEAATCARQHLVRPGETLFRIGLLYGVPWPEIQRANNIPNANLIFVGQTLCIPAVGTPTATPRPGATPTPAPSPTRGPTRTPFVTPTFRIVSVVRDQSVTIQTANFPANQRFDVLMGAYGTQGVNGTKVTTTDSGSGGTFSATYTIPAAFTGARRIAIRLQSASGFFSYNWFWNNSTP